MSWLSQYFHTVTGNKLSDVIPTVSRGEGSSLFDVGVKVSPSQETTDTIVKTTQTLQDYQGIIFIAIIFGGIYILGKKYNG